MAYLPFPKNWPEFTPKDKLGDWFEAYANIMELNVWVKTSVTGATYDDSKKRVDCLSDARRRVRTHPPPSSSRLVYRTLRRASNSYFP